MKRPSFQFYPADWQGNSNLRRCSHEEKGIWTDVMCLLHDQEEYGVLRWPLKEIAQAVGTTLPKLKGLVTKGVLKGADAGEDCAAYIYTPRSGRKDGDPVVLIPEQKGAIWYSSRMVRDEYVRTIRGESSRFGNNKDESPKPSPKQTPKDAPKPPLGDGSTSSSSSSSSNIEDRLERVVTETRADQKSDFQKIYETGSEIFPNLATANTSSIHQWLQAGCDVELDVIPEIRRHKGRSVGSWKFFTGGIMDAKATRETQPPKGTPYASSSRPSPALDRANKTDRAKAAVMRAATAGGYAPERSDGQAGAGGDPVSMLPVA